MSLQVSLYDTRGLNVRNITEERQLEIGLDIFLTLNRVIEEVHKKGQSEPGSQSANNPKKSGQQFLRFDGVHLCCCEVNDMHVLYDVFFL